MSADEKKKEQAQRLLCSFTDVDDRFLAEAMEEKPVGGSTGRNMRKYSRWALTAAACLTVVILGRYVVLHQDSNMISEKSDVTTVAQSETGIPSGASGESKVQGTAEEVDGAILQEAAEVQEEADGAMLQEAAEAQEDAVVQEAAEEPDGAMIQEAAEEPDGAILQEAAEEPDEAVVQEAAEAREEATVQDTVSEEQAQAMVSGESYNKDAAGEEADTVTGAMNDSVQIANPFKDVKTLEEAQKAAGFKIGVPDMTEPYTVIEYRVIEEEMLELIFRDKEDDTEGFRIRKAAGDEEISGDYNEYAKEKTLRLSDGSTVTLRGDKENEWASAVWTAAGEDGETMYSYAICAGEKTFTTQEIREMAETMTE